MDIKDDEMSGVIVDESAQIHESAATKPVPLKKPKANKANNVKHTTAKTTMPAKSPVLVYGPIEAKDTLYAIAHKIAPDHTVTIDQTMMALIRKNPRAFTEANINRLKSGYVLRVPTVDEIRSIPRELAYEGVSRENKDWHLAYSDALNGSVSHPRVIVHGAKQGANHDKTNNTTETGPKPIQLHSPLDNSIEAGTMQADDLGGTVNSRVLKAELAISVQALDTARQANHMLEMRVENMQNQQLLSQLQHENEQTPSKTDTAQKPKNTIAQSPKTTKPVDITKADKFAQNIPEPVENASNWFFWLILLVIIAGGGAGIYFWRKRLPFMNLPDTQDSHHGQRLEKIMIDERMNASTETTGDEEVLDDESANAETDDKSSESSAVSEPAEDQFEDFEHDTHEGEELDSEQASDNEDEDTELPSLPLTPRPKKEKTTSVDPIEEANVYLAYSRFSEAESSLLSAVEADPNRLELHVKLLEVYVNTQNKNAFVEALGGLPSNQDEADQELWAQIAALKKTKWESDENAEEDVDDEPKDEDFLMEFETGLGEGLGIGKHSEEGDGDAPSDAEAQSKKASKKAKKNAKPAEAGSKGAVNVVDTKMELAQAYIDMEDYPAAIDMLKEVLKFGDFNQQEKARNLLDQIGKDS